MKILIAIEPGLSDALKREVTHAIGRQQRPSILIFANMWLVDSPRRSTTEWMEIVRDALGRDDARILVVEVDAWTMRAPQYIRDEVSRIMRAP